MLPEYTASTGRRGFSDHAKLRAAIVMKCECFSCVTDLLDYLQNNLLIAHYCGFNIMKPLPSNWTPERFIKDHENGLLQKAMQSQVQKLYESGVLDASFIALDSTPISANTSQKNPKSFKTDKFKPENQPASDKDCALGVHTASNQHSEKKYEFFWGHKNHILVDCITGLPINELTTTADVADGTVTLDILKAQTNICLSRNVPLSPTKPMTSKLSTIQLRMFMRASAVFRSTSEIQRILKNCLPVVLFALQDWL